MRAHATACALTLGLLAHATVAAPVPSQSLLPLEFSPVPLGTVRPEGWLRDQLVVMANGLSGHLDLFWGDVNDSVWIGGHGDHAGAGHERGPYWLNGMVSLVAQLNATGDSAAFLAGEKDAALEVDVNAQVNSWIAYILEKQLPNGWLGPDDGFGGVGNTYWTGWNTAASLLQYADARRAASDEDTARRCEKATLRYIQEVTRRMKIHPMSTWSQNRWQDWAYIVHWLSDQAGSYLGKAVVAELLDAAALSQAQSWDWDAYYDQTGTGTKGAYVGKKMPKFPTGNVSRWSMFDHGVNNAMGTKSGAVWYRQSGKKSDAQRSYQKLTVQDEHQGQPHGMFSADECFGGRALNRGIELCAVVEQMYSLQHMFRVHGDPMFLDRCERIAYNALPGTISADMWEHQYLQQSNEVNALYGVKDHVWQTDGGDSTGFGVAPQFGCCTANMQQGWPKMVNNVLFTAKGGSAVVLGLIAPVSAKVSGLAVNVSTEYPFGDTVTLTLSGHGEHTAKELRLRIPDWADHATVSVDGAAAKPAKNGTMHSVPLPAARVVLELNPAVRLQSGWGLTAAAAKPTNALTVQRGALLYALHLEQTSSTVRTWQPFGNKDVNLETPSVWNVALDVSSINASSFQRLGSPGRVPFNTSVFPSVITGRGRLLPSWVTSKSAADEPPSSPLTCATTEEAPAAGTVACGAEQELTFVPYGSTNLRMAALPWIGA